MPIAPVGTAQKAASNTVTIDSTGAAGAGGLIVLVTTSYGTHPTAITDSGVGGSNTWTLAVSVGLAPNTWSLRIWYCLNPTRTGASHQISFNNNSYSSISAACFTGVSDVDTGNTASRTTSTSSTTYSQGNTTSQVGAGSLIVSACALGASGTPSLSVADGCAVLTAQPDAGVIGNLLAYRIPGSTTFVNPTFGSTTSTPWAAAAAVFLPTAGSSASGSGGGTIAGPGGSGAGASAAVSGTGAGAVSGPIGSGSGASAAPATVTGAGAGSVSGPTGIGVGTGATVATGSGAGSVPGPAGAGSGMRLVVITGTGAGSVAGPTGTGTGRLGSALRPTATPRSGRVTAIPRAY